MTLPAPTQAIFRIQNSPQQIIKDVFTIYTSHNVALVLWGQETEMKLMFGIQKKFDEYEALIRICNEYGISIQSHTTQVLRGTKLTVNVTLRV